MTYLALFSWPVVVMMLFRRFGPAMAVAVAIVGGYLLLPTEVEIRLPFVPDINKDTVAAVPALLMAMALFGAQAYQRQNDGQAGPLGLPGWLPRNGIINLLILMVLVGIIMTMLTNRDPISYGPTRLRGGSIFDGLSALLKMMVAIVPFLLARKFLARSQDHFRLLVVLCISGLLYSLLALYEVRMSPQLNKAVYGFFPHDWSQHKRGGGWRPIVFLHHGLWLGIFLACATLACAAMVRLVPQEWRMRAVLSLGWMFMALFLAKTLGAFMIVLILLPVVFLSARVQMLCAAGLCGAILLYPMLRAGGLTPSNQVLNVAAMVDCERALSFQTRITHEDKLLDKAAKRPLFGWGGWSRARIYDERGRDQSVTDGYWILILGESGWTGYIGLFGLLTIPTVILAMRQKAYEVTMATSALCLVLTANLIDLIPNATFTPLTWLIAGALAGRLELGAQDSRSSAQAPVAAGPARPSYTRFTPTKGRPDFAGGLRHD